MEPVSPSSVLNVVLMERRVLKGRTAIITTIIMGKMEIVLPEAYVMRVNCFGEMLRLAQDKLICRSLTINS